MIDYRNKLFIHFELRCTVLSGRRRSGTGLMYHAGWERSPVGVHAAGATCLRATGSPSISQTAWFLSTCARGILNLPQDDPKHTTSRASGPDLTKRDWEVEVLRHDKILNKHHFRQVSLCGSG